MTINKKHYKTLKYIFRKKHLEHNFYVKWNGNIKVKMDNIKSIIHECNKSRINTKKILAKAIIYTNDRKTIIELIKIIKNINKTNRALKNLRNIRNERLKQNEKYSESYWKHK